MKKSIFILFGLSLMTLNVFSQEKAKIKSENIFNDSSIIDIKESNSIPIDSLSIEEQNAFEIKYIKNKTDYSINKNGITYVILSSTKTTFRDCYKCLDIPNGCYARYEVQSRKYTEWENGAIKRVWNTTTRVFMGCGMW